MSKLARAEGTIGEREERKARKYYFLACIELYNMKQTNRPNPKPTQNVCTILITFDPPNKNQMQKPQ